MAGDKFNVHVNSWYKLAKEQTIDPPSGILTELFYALNNAIGGLQGGSKADPSELYNSEVLLPGATTFINNQSNSSNNNSPRAYLNWILFDEQFNYVSVGSGFEQVPEESYYNNNDIPNNITKLHVHDDLPITKSGFLYIYVSNETPNIDVFFDNLTVTHVRGQILSEDHYYPFGGRLFSICSQSAGQLENKYKYSGKEQQSGEFSDGSGLELYDFGWRMQDPQIGRWHSIDPKADRYNQFTPYCYVANMPMNAIDPDGQVFYITNEEGKGPDKQGKEYFERMNKLAGGIFQMNNKTGQVTLKDGAKLEDVLSSENVSAELAGQILSGINAEQTVNFAVTKANSEFDFDQFSSGLVDAGDFKGMDNKSAAALMSHIIAERYATDNYEENKGQIMAEQRQLMNEQGRNAETPAWKKAHTDAGKSAEARTIQQMTGFTTSGTRQSETWKPNMTPNKDGSYNQTIIFNYGNGVQLQYQKNPATQVISSGTVIKN